MTSETLQGFLAAGETIAIEFKRGGNGAESDTFESICAFLNRFGGDLFLGVENDGTVIGVPPVAAPQIAKHIVNVAGDPGLFQPTVYLVPEIIDYEGRTIVHVHVPNSGDVHSFKKVVYDRTGDADVKVKTTGQIAMLYIRKRNYYTEQRIYPAVTPDDLRLDLLPLVRQMAKNRRKDGHPWYALGDNALLESAGLVGEDRETGRRGFNLAAILLLGRDETIRDVCPAYMTDALLRVRDIDRYDDREVIRTNLIESYEQLMEFGRKHLPDPFFLERSVRTSLREIITREMIANVLIHREFTSPKPARFTIERNRMSVDNACRSSRVGPLSPDNLEPETKNPIIAAFFREIGLADQLGSGVRNLYKYARAYGGADPEIIEGDTFRISVHLPVASNLEDNRTIPVVPVANPVVPVANPVASVANPVASSARSSAPSGMEDLIPPGLLLRISRLNRRTADPSALCNAIVDLCSIQPMSAKQLATLLHRKKDTIQRIVTPMIGMRLSFLYPSQPRHPKQAYVASTPSAPSDSAPTP